MNYKLIPKSEFDRIRQSGVDKHNKMSLFADMCRFNTFVSVKKAGSGHMGSSFSAMDIVVYLYLHEMNLLEKGIDSDDRDIYFSSKGHDVPGLYAVFFALGIIEQKKLLALRRLGGLDGHPEVRIDGIEANSGSLGMGISKGKGMAWAKDYRKTGGRIFVLTGDGEFQEGQIWESFQSAAHQKINNITVIIDRNKFQTDMLVDDVNSIEDLRAKVGSFGWHVEKMPGHDFAAIEDTFTRLKNINDKPKFIIADTIKGKGVSFMEKPIVDESGKTYYKWHAGAPGDDYFKAGLDELNERIQAKASSLNLYPVEIVDAESDLKQSGTATKEYVKTTFGEALCEIAERRKDLVVLDGDLSADCGLRPFEKAYPNRFIENGIAEQDMVSMAGGLAKNGLLPVVNTFASFLAARANEQIYNNACEETKIIYAMHFSGIIPAGPGKSHQSVRDISLLGAIPNMTILQPCNSAEAKMAVEYCVDDAKENCALRLVIGPSPRIMELPAGYKLEFGRGVTLREGKDALMFAYGPVMVHEAMLASEILEDYNFGLQVVNMPWLNRIDSSWLLETVCNHKNIYVLEDHSNFGGLGDNLMYSIAKNMDMAGIKFNKIGLDEYPECGTPQEVLAHHRMDGHSLAERVSGIKPAASEKEAGAYTADAPQ